MACVNASGSIALGQDDVTPVAFTQAIAGLAPGTTYSFCAIAGNDAGLGFGLLQQFTTLGDAGTPGDGGMPRDAGTPDAGPGQEHSDRVSCGCGQSGAAPLALLVPLAFRLRRRSLRAACAAAAPSRA
jgi:hypothetical protein